MIEKDLEKKISTKLESVLVQNSISNYQLLGTWTCDNVVESSKAGVIVTVKVRPRAYETYTIPTANITAEITVLARAEVDFNGMNYLEVTEKLFDVLHSWQKSIDQTVEDLTIEGKFDPAGLRLDGGDAGLDQQAKVWVCN